MPKYNSQELDTETGYYFYNARHYDPVICRFVTADSVVDGELSPMGWNRYMYVHGNPIRYMDPTGHSKTDYEDTHFNDANNDTYQAFLLTTKVDSKYDTLWSIAKKTLELEKKLLDMEGKGPKKITNSMVKSRVKAIKIANKLDSNVIHKGQELITGYVLKKRDSEGITESGNIVSGILTIATLGTSGVFSTGGRRLAGEVITRQGAKRIILRGVSGQFVKQSKKNLIKGALNASSKIAKEMIMKKLKNDIVYNVKLYYLFTTGSTIAKYVDYGLGASPSTAENTKQHVGAVIAKDVEVIDEIVKYYQNKPKEKSISDK